MVSSTSLITPKLAVGGGVSTRAGTAVPLPSASGSNQVTVKSCHICVASTGFSGSIWRAK